MIGAELLTFVGHGDDRGQLVAVEAEADIPFPVRRVYYIFDTAPGVRRGYHAHKELEQVLICMHGSCRILLDNGHTRESVLLDSPLKGLHLFPCLWREMYDFSPGSVLMVLASERYSESDYIRDYGEFLNFVSKNSN